jgi:hypothetical protein
MQKMLVPVVILQTNICVKKQLKAVMNLKEREIEAWK